MATQVIRHSIAEPLGTHPAMRSSAGFMAGPELVTDSVIGVSRWAENARRQVSELAGCGNSVILEGEPGTGKKFLASLIHRCGPRRERPFLTVALGLASEELAHEVLFGSERHPMDDSARSQKGLLELAAGGTLYIDGLVDASPGFTADLTRIIERSGLNREGDDFVRICFGSTTQSSTCRWRSFTNRASKVFNCETLEIQPLRERRDDIEPLATHFIKQRCKQIHREVRMMSPEVTEVFRNYDWPRNVSELRRVVNHLLRQITPPSLDVAMLPAYMLGSEEAKKMLCASGLDLDSEVRQFEMNLICAALRQSRGLQNKAAQLLRIRPTTLFMKIKRYGIEVAEFK
ncbi:MAG: sigma 54-interacting transcriptional regulator [Blastocatellia bacterium]